MATVDARWHGLDEALAKMRGLTPKLRKSGFKRAGIKAMAPVRDSARATAERFNDPETKSNIPKKIVIQSASDRTNRRYGGDAIVTKVGVQGGAVPRKGREDEGHWRFLEFGTKDMAAQPFMRPALEKNVSKVITIYSSSLSKAIDDAIKSDIRSAARRAAKVAGA